MRLKKLEIYGFKSFAERTELVFEQGITGIVGPNGSGKSNISDAVRWVLGEQNARSLRGGKMEDIIFNGTQTRRKLGYCEVSLVFDNQDHALPIDFAEVMVTRRVYRSGESEYSLNKTACRLKDIVDLFRDTGIGREGYSLIGQGRIDEILSARSEDRRQVFEEAAGIVKYKVRKEEAERRMENTRQNLLRVQDIVDELGNQLEPLAEQSETARRFLALREQLRGLELNAFLLRSDRLRERAAALGQTITGLSEAIAQAEARAAQGTARRVALEEALAAQDRLVSDAHEGVLSLSRALEAQEGENNVARADLAHDAQDVARLTAEHAEVTERLGALEALHESAAGDQTEQHGQLDAQRVELAAMEQQAAAAQAGAERAEQALDAHKADIITAMNRLSDVRSGQTRLTTMRQSLLARREELHGAGEGMAAEGARLAEAAQAAQRMAGGASAQLETLQQEAARLDERVRAAAQAVEALTAALAQHTGSQQALSSRLRVLREMERDYEGYQHAVKQVLLHAGRDGGVHGVVATLLRVPKDYEKAIEVVLGGALQNLVTDDEFVAERMIAYLRDQRYGRATFLPITSVRGRVLTPQERQVLTMPGCLGVASELVGFDAPYRGVMESLLGRTVVATDLKAGIEIMRRGRHAFRLVTLTGDVMHSGGAMSGGSAQSRMTSLLSREREIAEHAQQLTELAATIAQAKAELAALEAERAEHKRLRSELYARLHQEEIAVAREQERLQRAQDELQAHRDASARQQQMGEQIADSLQDIDAQLADMSARQDGQEQDTQAMHQRTHALQSALGEARAQAETLREQVTARRVSLAALEREVEALRRDAARLDSERQTLRQRAVGLTAQLARCREAEQAHRQVLAEGEAAQRTAQAALEEAREALRALEAAREAQHTALRAMGEETDTARAQAASDVDKHHRAELQLTRVEGDLKQMQDRIWEEYELTYAGAEAFKTPGFELVPAERRIEEIRAQIREMGSVNVNAIEDYIACRTRYDDLCAQREDLLRAGDDLQGIIEGLVTKMERQFREQFAMLGRYFAETFTRLFGGGYAELKLLDPSDALGSGIEIVAQPPGKKLQLLSLLSGGERALTAIAILFAMLRLKPTPFCILDEIEAALDDANINHFADFLSEFAQGTQFVVVTHRKGTMERCDALYGVAMEEKGISRMVSVQLTDAMRAG